MPIIAVPEELRRNFIANRTEFLRNLACYPSNSMSPFYKRASALFASIDSSRENPWDFVHCRFADDFRCADTDIYRYLHFDLAQNADRVGFSMACAPHHVDGDVQIGDTVQKIRLPFIHFDFLGIIEVSKQNELDFQMIPEIVLDLRRRGFPIDLITFDRFQSSMIMQILQSEGFYVSHLSIDRTAFSVKVVKEVSPRGVLKRWRIKRESTSRQYADAHNALKNAIYQKRTSIPAWEQWSTMHPEDTRHPFIAEAVGCETQDDGTVDHSAFTKIDLLSGMAGAAYNCQNNAPDIGDASYSQDPSQVDTQFRDSDKQRLRAVHELLSRASTTDDMYQLQRFMSNELGQVDLFDIMHDPDNPWVELGI